MTVLLRSQWNRARIQKQALAGTRNKPVGIESWESTRPWAASTDSLPSGFVAQDARGSEDASFLPDGRIALKPQFFSRSPETRRAIVYHEAGHALEGSYRQADWGRLGIDPFEIISWPGAQGLGHNYSEVLAEAYAALWSDPAWFDRMGADRIHDLIVRMAREQGFPVP